MPSSNPATLPMKVLVVDDTTVNRQILRVFLERLGFVFLAAEDGDQAIEVFQRERPDIVLMDVMMPQVNGYEATRRIRELSGERWVPVIFISALDRDDNLIDGLEAGGDDFMSKPLNFIVLDAKLRSLRRMVELQQHLEEVRRRTAAITENIVDGVVTIDASGLIQSVNPAVTRIFGYSDTEMLGHDVSMLMAPDDAGQHGERMQRYLATGEGRMIGPGREMQALHKNGQVFPVEIGISEINLQGQRLFIGIVRDITERKRVEQRLRENAERLQAYHEHQEREHALTREIVERQMARPGLADPCIRYWVEPAADFSGDIVAAARAADGKLFAMLSDGCGHGLAPAISVMPVLSAFYGLIETDAAPDLQRIIGELNRQLYATLPRGRFVASAVLCLDQHRHTADIWVGGIPTLLWLGPDRRVKRRFASSHLSLGIIETDADLLTVESVEWTPGDCFVVCSDGLLESPTRSGEELGIEAFVGILEACSPTEDLLGQLQARLRQALAPVSPSDDISVLIVECRN